MAKTEFWVRFGETILAAPDLTLAAFLGHAPSIAIAKDREIHFPKTADFQIDRAYDPNRHKLDLDEAHLNSKFLLLCISAWGAQALVRAVNVCSHLQCMHHSSCSSKFTRLRNDAAFSLQELIDAPTPVVHQRATELLRLCQSQYFPYEDAPDSGDAEEVWYHLGAPWFGLETALGNSAARSDCGEVEPAPANPTWCRRQTVWPERAFDAAANWSSHALVADAVRSTLITWAVSNMGVVDERRTRR
jgi:hypothetical protein